MTSGHNFSSTYRRKGGVGKAQRGGAGKKGGSGLDEQS